MKKQEERCECQGGTIPCKQTGERLVVQLTEEQQMLVRQIREERGKR